MLKTMEEILEAALKKGPFRLVVAAAEDEAVLRAVEQAEKEGLVHPILAGNEDTIHSLCSDYGISFSDAEYINASSPEEACMKAASFAGEGKADVLMKGFTDTSVVMRAVLSRENGLRTERRISHDLVLEVPGYDRLLHVSDATMNIAPDIQTKADIIRNTVEVAHALGNDCPKVAVICAVEKVNKNMPATIDARELTDMNARGEISGCMIQGPLAMDNAVSLEAARHKEINGAVAGNADVLLVPTIEAGNILVKTAEHLAHAKKAGVILGAGIPLALTSRATNVESKVYTIALACLVACYQLEMEK